VRTVSGEFRTGLGDPECSLDVLEPFFPESLDGDLLVEETFLGNFGGILLGERFSGLRED